MSQTDSGNSISDRRTRSAGSDLAEKVLIVTGASHGIGAACSRSGSRRSLRGSATNTRMPNSLPSSSMSQAQAQGSG